MGIKVCKFGGTSMATASSIRNIEKIIKSDVSRKYIIVSAPGKRYSDDEKVTDLLYQCNKQAIEIGDCSIAFNKIRDRFMTIATELNIDIAIVKTKLDEIENNILLLKSADYAASRGEYLSAYITAQAYNFDFIDAVDLIAFNESGEFNEDITNDIVSSELQNHEYAVIPGFYGALPNKTIKTFSRGGSDVTGAIIARGVSADVYENWTDVNGFMSADPRIVNNPLPIDQLSYKELRELSYMGASVLHPESIFPVKHKGIPINIKNTFEPENIGTYILKDCEHNERLVTGIAGKKGFCSITIEKSMMNNQVGFMRKVLSIFEHNNISVEHTPSGIDTLSIIVSEADLNGKEDAVIADLNKKISPDHIEIYHHLCLIATVGRGMAYKIGTASRLFSALSKKGVNIRMIDQGSSELNIIVAVQEKDYSNAIIAIYMEFMK